MNKQLERIKLHNKPFEQIVPLNIGDNINNSILRSTLTSAPGSKLEAMFNLNNELKIQNGRVFIDRNP